MELGEIMPKEKLCSVEKICRINIRYYLIRVDRKYYVIDYSSPKNFKNYFLALFPEELSSWDVYDVTETKDNYRVRNQKSFNIDKIATTILLLYLFHVMFFPNKFNIGIITKDLFIFDHPLLFIGISFLTTLVLIALLMFKTNQINFDGIEKYSLINNKPRKKNILKGLLIMVIGYGGIWAMAFFGTNYANIFMFGISCVNYMIFIKFIEFQPSMNGRIYYIKKEKE